MDWIALLRPSTSARVKDIYVFNRWEQCEISTADAIKYMKRNNRMPDCMHIDPVKFERWLNGLGYRR